MHTYIIISEHPVMPLHKAYKSVRNFYVCMYVCIYFATTLKMKLYSADLAVSL